MHPLMLICPAFPPPRMEALTAVAAAHLGQLAQALAEHGIIPPTGFAEPTGARQGNELAGPAGREAVGVQ